MKAIEVIAIVILTLVGFWLVGPLGLLVLLLIALGYMTLGNLHRKYFSQPEEQPKRRENWQCSQCQRINSPRAKICTKCGFEKDEWVYATASPPPIEQ